jgi:Cu/Ag efflux pump CusA
VPLPIGVHIIYSGSAEARAETQQELIVNSSVAGIIIVLLLGMVFKKFQNLILVLLNLPFALVGGVLAVFFTGGILSIGTLVGFVTLFGLSTRNSIMLMSHYDHLVKVEGAQLNIETVIRGATERFVL